MGFVLAKNGKAGKTGPPVTATTQRVDGACRGTEADSLDPWEGGGGLGKS